MSRVFIDRPIFAWVIAIILMLLGAGAIQMLPIAQYPDVAPPEINIRAEYPGASAETLENSVTQVIEQQLTGIDGLLYFQSSSSSRGQARIRVTFRKGATNPDIAQVQVQNRVQQALPRLPQQVQQQGLRVSKSNPDYLLIVAVFDETDQRTNQDVSDYLESNLQDPLARISGVGDTNVFGSQYAMRIWLNPTSLASYQLVPGDVIAAIETQNAEVAAGEIGALPMPDEQMLDATVTAQSRLQTPEQFADIILKSSHQGATVRLKDVARVELGSESYDVTSRVNGHPGAGIAISLTPDADALSTAAAVKEKVAELARDFPAGLAYAYPLDSTTFIELSIDEVVKTLIEAILLVVIVMFVFLQSWRTTLIPAIAVPVVLLGTFAILLAAGFSINTLTLFGMVLAVGVLVDDAIVVVENVERLMEENPDLSPREATIQSMGEIQLALVGTALVLSAVLLPMAFFGGSTGVIYRQFSITIVSAMVLSIAVALILTPALTATLLKRRRNDEHGLPERRGRRLAQRVERLRTWFNNGFATMTERYVGAVREMVDHKLLFLGVYAVIVALLVVLFIRLPTGFLPTEDQGTALIQFRLPPGATQSRTNEVALAIEQYMREQESGNVETLFTATGTAGGGGGGGGQNTGIAYMALADWAERQDASDSASAIVDRAGSALSALRDAQVFALVPPAIRGLGNSSGFTMQLQNTGELSREEFNAARDELLGNAAQDPALVAVRPSELPDVPTLRVTLDSQKLHVLGLDHAIVNTTLASAWGGRYVNDFIDRGRIKRVFVQGDAPYRDDPRDIDQWFVRSSDGEMAPFSSFATLDWSTAPTSLSRFAGQSSFEIQGQPAPGVSSGEAMERIAALADRIAGTSIAWSGISYQERQSSGQAPMLYALSLLVVFLFLAALYESWSIPVAVLLIVPLGLVGAIVAVTLRGLDNDVFMQIGLLTTMGLAAKNAILMIEFAAQAEKEGKEVIDAALDAARIRLRPILMTSLAFVFGVLPLALSSGPGANARVEIGTAVIGGMLTATILAVFYIPLFFVLVRKSAQDGLKKLRERRGNSAGERRA